MNRRITAVLALFAAASAAVALCPPGSEDSLPQQRLPAIDVVRVQPTIEQLRRKGPESLRKMLERYDRDQDPRLIADIDAVAGQKDAVWSRLFWYSDLDQAKAAAKEQHKPILYLRMLGKLTDEYSCANSRFFRTVLYANTSVSDLLRDKFILVWESERPVPVVTIDYGDGRVLKRTITGNSAHYVLDSEGRVIDVVPGLYDPATFAGIITAAANISGGSRRDQRQYLQTTCDQLLLAWQHESAGEPSQRLEAFDTGFAQALAPAAPVAAGRAIGKMEVELPIVRGVTSEAPRPAVADERDVGKTRLELPIVFAVAPNAAPAAVAAPVPPAAPRADVAAVRAEGKRVVEMPLVRAITPDAELAAVRSISAADEATWKKLTAAQVGKTRLDEHSIALIRSQNPNADDAAIARMVDQFQKSIAADTVRNNYQFRRQALGWMLESRQPIALADLNQRIYAELFLTPRSDPWLGLKPDDTYSALSGDGCDVSSSK